MPHRCLKRPAGLAAANLPVVRPLALAIHLIALVGTLALSGWVPDAFAQNAAATLASRRYDISAGPLSSVLTRFSREAGVFLVGAGNAAEGKTSAGLKGSYSVTDGFAALLAGTGLEALRQADGSYSLQAAPAATPSSESVLPVVRVTASTVTESAYGPVPGYVAKRSATGTKTDTPIIETPQSISVVTADRIEAIGATRLTEALAYTPGVQISGGYDSRFDWINLRGFDSYSPGFYLDGLQLRNNASYSLWRTETYGTERIEVLRGPTSVLYGQNGPGGAVNVVSKRPTSEPLHELRLQLGNYSRREIAGDFSGPLDDEGTVLYRITGLISDSQTQVNHVPDDRFFIAPALTLRPSSNTTLTVLGSLYRIRGGTSYGFLPVQGTLLNTPNGRIPTSAFVGEPNVDRYNLDQWSVGYLFEHRSSDTWTLRQNLRYGSIDTDYWQVYGNGFATVNAMDPADPANYRLLNRVIFGSPEKGKVFNLDNQAQATLHMGDWQHTVLFGLDYQRSRFDVKNYYDNAPPIDIFAPVYGQNVAIPAPYVDSSTTLAQTGLYVQDQIKYGDRWAATLGGRYDRATVTSHDRLLDLTTRQNDGKFSGRAGLVYLAPNGLAPYISYSESFSPVTSINPATGSPFKPETGLQYEAGLRYQPPGRNDSYSAAIFDLRRQNVITYSSSFHVPEQVGEVRVKGLELEAMIQPLRQLNLTAAYSWTPSAKVTESNNPDQIGKQDQSVSEHQLSLWSDYRFSTGVKFGLGVRYVGSNRGHGETAPVRVPSYTLLDALLSYDFDHWNFALNARNLTDKIYLANNCDAFGCGYGERRRIIATATYRW